MLWAKFGEISPVVQEKKIFDISLMYFHYFIIISPWKKVKPLLCTHLNSSPTNAKFGWNLSCGSEEEDFQIVLMNFCYFIIISP